MKNTDQPALPSGWSKTGFLQLIEEAAPHLGLKPTTMAVFRRLAKCIPADAFSNADKATICYEKQLDMAVSLMMTDRTFRRHEKRLADIGLISVNTIHNGSRKNVYANGRIIATAGICLGPALRRFAEMLTIRDQKRAEAEEFARLRTTLSQARRNVISRLGASQALEREKANWTAPRLMKVAESIKAEIARLEQFMCEPPDKNAAAPDKNDRCYRQDTKKNMDVMASETAKPNCHPVAAHHTKHVTFQALATDEAMFYFDAYRKHETDQASIRRSIRMRVLELGIGESKYRQAVSDFGEDIAQTMILIIDANRNHPTHPVRSPIGLWTRFAELHRNKALNLARSIDAIVNRKTLAEKQLETFA